MYRQPFTNKVLVNIKLVAKNPSTSDLDVLLLDSNAALPLTLEDSYTEVYHGAIK